MNFIGLYFIFFFLENDLFSVSLCNTPTVQGMCAGQQELGFSPTQLVVAGPEGLGVRENAFAYSPSMGVVWDSSRQSSSKGAYLGLLPTKTSRLLIQSCGNGLSFISNGRHVFLTRFVNLFSHLIFVVVVITFLFGGVFLCVSASIRWFFLFFLPSKWAVCALCSCGALLSGSTLHVGGCMKDTQVVVYVIRIFQDYFH